MAKKGIGWRPGRKAPMWTQDSFDTQTVWMMELTRIKGGKHAYHGPFHCVMSHMDLPRVAGAGDKPEAEIPDPLPPQKRPGALSGIDFRRGRYAKSVPKNAGGMNKRDLSALESNFGLFRVWNPDRIFILSGNNAGKGIPRSMFERRRLVKRSRNARCQ